MDENPYRSPDMQAPAVGVLSGRREDVRRVAVYQKCVLACILIYLLMIAFLVVVQVVPELPVGGPLLGMVGALVALSFWILAIAATVFVFLLAIKLYQPVIGVLLGILTLVPCLGLLVLLAINGRATSILRANGYRVGLMGADLSQF